MAGRGPISDNEMVRMENVYLLNGDDTWEYAQPWYDEAYTGVDSNRDENGIIWGGYNRYSTVRKPDAYQGTNPAMFFAKAMAENGGIPENGAIGIISNARGNSGVEEWQKGYVDFDPSAGPHSGHADFDMFEEAVRRTKIAMKTGTLKGILWVQGEGACRDTGYVKKLNEFVYDLREELGVGTEVPFIAAEMPSFLNDSEHYNERIRSFQSFENNTDFITLTDGMTHIGDSVHYDTASQKILGPLFAEKISNPSSLKMYDEFTSGTDGWKKGYNNTEKESNTVNITNEDGALKAEIKNAHYSTLSTATLKKEVNSGSGIPLKNGKVRISTRFRYDCTYAAARLFFKMNRPETEKTFGTDAVSKNRYSLFRVSDTGFWYADGTTQYGDFATGSAISMVPFSGATGLMGKWMSVDVVLDAENEKVDYFLTVENGDGTTSEYKKTGASLKRALMTEYVNGTDTALSTREDDLETIRRITLLLDTTGVSANVEMDYFRIVPEIDVTKVSSSWIEHKKPQFVINTVEKLDNINETTVKLTAASGNVIPASVVQNENLVTITAKNDTDAKNFAITVSGAKYGDETLLDMTVNFSMEYYVADDFENGTDGWKEGNHTSGKPVSVAAENGLLKATIPYVWDGNNLNAPSIVREINGGKGVEFTEDRKIILKTRFKITNIDAGGRLYFKINRPEEKSKLSQSDWGGNHYTLFMLRADANGPFLRQNSIFSSVNQLELRSMQVPGINPSDAKGGVENKWFNVELHLDGYHNKYDIYVNTDGYDEAVLKGVPLVSAYTDDTKTALADDLSAFKNVTLLTLNSGASVEMDYFRVYETPVLKDAQIVDGNAVYTINTSVPVTDNSLSGVKLLNNKGEEVTDVVKSYDKTNKDIILTVREKMTDERYTLMLSGLVSEYGDVLRDETIYVWSPEKEVRDEFDGSTGKWENVVTCSESITASDIKTENGVLTAALSSGGNANTGSLPGIIRVLNGGAGIEIPEGQDFVIKTRIKRVVEEGKSSRIYIKVNAPYDYKNATAYADSFNHYTLALMRDNDSYSFGYTHGITYYDQQNYMNYGLSHKDMRDKWVDIELHIHGGSNTMDVMYSFEDENGEIAKFRRFADLTQPAGNHYKDYADKKVYSKPVTKFDTIRTISILGSGNAQNMEVDYFYAYLADPAERPFVSAQMSGNVVAEGAYKSGSTLNERVSTVVALYSEVNGGMKLEDIQIYEDKLLPYGYYNKTNITDIKVPDDGKAYFVKAFLLEDGKIEPLTESISR